MTRKKCALVFRSPVLKSSNCNASAVFRFKMTPLEQHISFREKHRKQGYTPYHCWRQPDRNTETHRFIRSQISQFSTSCKLPPANIQSNVFSLLSRLLLLSCHPAVVPCSYCRDHTRKHQPRTSCYQARMLAWHTGTREIDTTPLLLACPREFSH